MGKILSIPFLFNQGEYHFDNSKEQLRKVMAVQDVLYTSNPIRDYEFSWTIEHFSLTPDELQGPPFSPIPGFPENLCLKLRFEEVYDSSWKKYRHYVEVVLVHLRNGVEKSKCNSLTFSGSTSLYNINGKCLVRENSTICHKFDRNFTLFNYTSDLSYLRLSKPEISRSKWNLKEDKLVVKGKLTFSSYDTANSYSPTAIDNSEACIELVKDLKTIFESGSSYDITFSVGKKTLRAHKIILISRSPVFAKMFDSDMLERNSNKIVIEDADFHAFNCFLMFLYTGMVKDKKWDTVLALYSLAHKYQVKSLHAICSLILGYSLTIDSVCSVLVLSDLHDDEDLKNVAKVFIRRHLDQIAGTTQWGEIITSKPQLVKEVLA